MERRVEWTDAVLLDMRETFEFYDCRNGTSLCEDAINL